MEARRPMSMRFGFTDIPGPKLGVADLFYDFFIRSQGKYGILKIRQAITARPDA